MTTNQEHYDQVQGDEEHVLALEDGRQLAYATNGPPTSRVLVIFFSGLFSVGRAADVPAPLRELGALWISPTLPGFGNSSSRKPGDAYHTSLIRDMNALLAELYPTGEFDSLYVSGGSYGTVQAQMLYGASYDEFPAGRKTAGCMLLAGFSPFKHQTNYTRDLSWQNYFSVGPPAKYVPFWLLQRLVSSVIAKKIKTQEGAEQFLQEFLFLKMDDNERRNFASYLAKVNRTEAGFITKMAEGTRLAGVRTWQGFLEVADVVHSDWGFSPSDLDDEHASKPMLIVGSEKDDTGGSSYVWLSENYKNSVLRVLPGGHISSLYYLDDLWEQLIKSSQAGQ
ncbi:unnamed protein product [Clonostachys byssicola]|uniref:AB hydrolase-1 domain-containing protein n=1 Tax=Clonostachys byssicola TaxID=160290 RepID=A0A9N9UBW7_9HYPO|nr:unnamed protein product [Clonostachys byssicola]